MSSTSIRPTNTEPQTDTQPSILDSLEYLNSDEYIRWLEEKYDLMQFMMGHF